MKNKILFLDIDGVINSQDNMYSHNILWNLNNKNKSRDEYGELFDERCVRWLKWICDKTECKIVLSSSWRCRGLSNIQLMWKIRNLPSEVIDTTPLEVSEWIYAETNNEADRGYEIQEWIENNKPERYCIVDDDSDMLECQKAYFVQTDSGMGLNYKTAHAIVAILNKL